MKRTVVALTEAGDTHLELVQPYLSQPMVVLGSQDVDKTRNVSLAIDQNGKEHVMANGAIVASVAGVWYRKPKPYVADEHVPPNFIDYVNEAQQSHYILLRDAFPKAHLVSDFYAIRRADNKYLQLRLAKQCGFRIPASLFTASAGQAQSFIRKYDSCVVKTLVTKFPEIDGEQTYFFTKKVDKNNLPDFNGLYLAPALFQQCIDAQYDVRIVVVGGKAFGSIITNEGLDGGAIRDWRLGHIEQTVRFESCKLPNDIAEKCIDFTKRSNLQFSAFDFVVDYGGNYWFIENNPNGQWGFVEESTQQAIAQEIAHLLEFGNNTTSL